MATVASWADACDTPLHIHSSEQVAEVEQCRASHGCTPTALMREHGVLGPRTTAVHATHLTDQDITDLRDSATGVCFCPTTERDLGDGIGPAAALIDGPGPFSLGSDSHAMIDMLEEARAVELDERLASRRRGSIPAARLLTAATATGTAPWAGRDAGRITVGARADLVALDLDLGPHRGRRGHPGERRVRGERPPTSPTSWSTAVPSSPTGTISTSATSGGHARKAIGTLWEDQ